MNEKQIDQVIKSINDVREWSAYKSYFVLEVYREPVHDVTQGKLFLRDDETEIDMTVIEGNLSSVGSLAVAIKHIDIDEPIARLLKNISSNYLPGQTIEVIHSLDDLSVASLNINGLRYLNRVGYVELFRALIQIVANNNTHHLTQVQGDV